MNRPNSDISYSEGRLWVRDAVSYYAYGRRRLSVSDRCRVESALWSLLDQFIRNGCSAKQLQAIPPRNRAILAGYDNPLLDSSYSFGGTSVES